MSRALITLIRQADFDKARRWLAAVPVGTRLEFKKPTRSTDQNSKMWAMLTDISKQVEWHGHKLTPEDYKCLFSAGLRKTFVVPDLEGCSFVMLGLRTSDMNKEEMSNLIELMYKFGAERDVKFTGPEDMS